MKQSRVNHLVSRTEAIIPLLFSPPPKKLPFVVVIPILHEYHIISRCIIIQPRRKVLMQMKFYVDQISMFVHIPNRSIMSKNRLSHAKRKKENQTFYCESVTVKI